MGKTINHTKLSETLALSECTDGFWLWDETRGMNLAMKAKTATAAFVEALGYYQHRLAEVEKEYTGLRKKVDAFLAQFVDEEDSCN